MTQTGVFGDRMTLTAMLNLRRTGATFETLATLFNCDWTSVEYQCKKYAITPLEEPIGIKRLLADILKKEKVNRWETIDGERINKGMKYQDYFKERHPHYKSSNYW